MTGLAWAGRINIEDRVDQAPASQNILDYPGSPDRAKFAFETKDSQAVFLLLGERRASREPSQLKREKLRSTATQAI